MSADLSKLTVLVPPDLNQALAQAAKRRFISRSAFVRLAITNEIEREAPEAWS